MANEAVIVIAILALLFFLLFFKLIGKSMKWIFKLLIHAISGFIVLFLVNVVGGIIGIQLDLSLINAIVVGALGIPGVILLLFIKYLL
ncbi:MAG: pro-sigmaK processing inhibitor BofA family protein [Lachnospiraceae bacterium]|jgi:inhibitor of the pro-sigma K processing machinery|nr:pro-sigmaK processing inhibitor BofA family protein [Lachnospiraceae bacterium]MBQ2564065.1 pro-sigmaK processing inhibitor BofA family protein [Oscillospiraceae bacterium]MBQ5598973.1 pro-sigmaK processing inhibitor BofA family protein [Lachnospiraceae bacterium]